MATHMADLILDSSTDANFREWGKAISDRFAAFGWVKSADTGQIDWSTVTTTTSSNSVRGYEIWRMADTFQATAPVFLKIEYSTGGSSYPQEPKIFVTLGTGSNGSGGLTGQVGTRVVQGFYGSPSATTRYRCVFSGDVNRFNMCLGVNTGSGYYHLWLNVERSKDASGADTAEGAIRMGSSYSGGAHQHFLPMSGTIPPNENTIGCMGPAAGTGVSGSDVILYPIFPFNADMKNPVRGAVGYFKADITQDWIIQSAIYGIPQNFYIVGYEVPGPMVRGANSGLALRYE